ncbi:MAG: flagellar M-ring protein FliF C-terminal domain-containing protein [Planctomycetota bacterium]|nr:flagellar M-ring protein FliF C-terminal domain-containing protein [Planctomycetota bacterium]
MDALRRTLATIQKQLGALSGAHKVIVACSVVIVLLTLGLVLVLTSSPSRVDLLPGATPEDQERAKGHLDALGIESRWNASGRLEVSAKDAARASSSLARANLLPNDKALYFESLLASQSWMNSRQVNEQNFRIALENELARMIADLNTVDSARVRLDIPEVRGLGVGVRTPTASVSARSDDGRALSQGVVDAIAHLVQGSVAGLTVQHVTVVDAGTGQRRSVTSDSDASPTLAMEHAAKVEAQARAKMQELLAYIPGVVVAVTASVDVTRSTAQVQSYLPSGKGSVAIEKKTSEVTTSTTEASSGGAVPGVQANQTADITRAGASGAGGIESESSESTSESEVRVGSRTETIVDPRGQSTSVAVSVNVPTGYVARLIKDAAGAGAPPGGAGATAPAEPDAQALRTYFDTEVRPSIVAVLQPHLRAMVAQSNSTMPPADLRKMIDESISVSLVPGEIPAGPATQAAGMLSSLGAGGLGGGLIEKVALGALALFALGFMAMLVRKSGRKTETPTAEELVGMPPALESAGDVIGEAEEGETALAGIEVDEREMEAAKRLEQVGEMVGADPAAAARMVRRWINIED